VEQDDEDTFRPPRRWQILIVALTVLPSCALLLTAPLLGAAIALSWILFWTLVLPLYTVQLRPDGVKLHGWWLPWTDVSAVAYRSLFGLPHFRVKRHDGFSWWIPLYYAGAGDLSQALIRAAPPGDPFRLVSMPTSR